MTVEHIWRSIPLKPKELALSRVLRCGQTFRWKNIDDVWSFTTEDRIVLLKQDDDHLHYSWIMAENYDGDKNSKKLENETLSFVKDYFCLDIKLESLYEQWLMADKAFHKVSEKSPFVKFPGIRILRQDPWETVISFICSSNNNVKRISKMCDSLCTRFGKYINEYNGFKFYSFPTPLDLTGPKVELQLREFGFGYRARYIFNTATKFVNDKDFPEITLSNLHSMREASYEDTHEFLLQLDGVGPKVADCICLMALDKHDIVPVDTHVYQIAIRDFKFKGKRDLKTLNKQIYHDIRQLFKWIFGDYAGWAQSVLFTSDLSDLNNGINHASEQVEVKTEVKTEIKEEDDSVTPNKRRKYKSIEDEVKYSKPIKA